MNFLGAAIAFFIGVGIAIGNYGISKYILKNHANYYAAAQIIRQLIQIAYLLILLLLGDYTPWNNMWLLVGGCLGVTLPMFWFTFKLVKLNDAKNTEKEETSDG